MDELEALLRSTGQRVQVSDLDGFAAATLARREQRGRLRIVRGSSARYLAVAAATVLLALAAALVVPASRDAMAELFGVKGVRLKVEDPPPATTAPSSTTIAATTTTSLPPDPLVSLRLGRAVPLADARAARPGVLAPTSIAAPDAAYVGDRPPGLVTLLWKSTAAWPEIPAAPGVGLLVQRFDGSFDAGFEKGLPGANYKRTQVGGRTAYFIEGDHKLTLYLASGIVEDSTRWSSNALVWSTGSVTYRIEAHLTQDQLLALAAALA